MYNHPQSPFYIRGDEIGKDGDVAELLQSAGNVFHHLDTPDITTICSMHNAIKASNVSVECSNSQFGELPKCCGSALEKGQFLMHKGGNIELSDRSSGGGGTTRNAHFYNCQNETLTNKDARKNQLTGLVAGDSRNQSKGRIHEQKELVKLAQNREAARKSRIRKKAYVKELECSQQRLAQLDHALRRTRQQVSSRFSVYQSNCNGGVAFDTDHASWAEEHQTQIDDLRWGLNSNAGDTQLQLLVDAVLSHYEKLLLIKKSTDMFHILSGVWRSPIERSLMWLGGFRSSDMLKVLEKKIQPVTEQQLVGICNLQQLVGICNLQQSGQEAEDALSQGIEALQLSLIETMSPASNYMNQMALAMTKIATIQNFLNQADLLRLHTLQQLQRILTTRQAACALLAINDYKSRLRALSSLWLALPKGS